MPLRSPRATSRPVALATLLTAAGCSSGSISSVAPDAAPAADAGTTRDAAKDAVNDAPLDTARPVDAVAPADVNTADVGTPDAPAIDAGGPTDAGKPPPPLGDAAAASAPVVFALHHLWLGDTPADPTFPVDPTNSAWSTFGYNIDGLITNENSTDVCTLDTAKGATTKNQVDGVNGIDNSFGKTIVPLLASALSNLSQTVSGSIAGGSFTVLIDTNGLTSSPTQTNTGLTGSLFSGAAYAGHPALNDAGAFALTDTWPVSSSSLLGPSLDAGAAVTFPQAYVNDGLWVNGTPSDVTLLLLLQGQPLTLRIHQALITFQHTVDAAGQDHASHGMISGVLTTREFLHEINEVAAEQQYCAQAGLLLGFMAAASDILHDGTNVAGQACDGISIGLAFDADAIAQPTTVVPAVDAGGLPPPCLLDAGF